MQNIKSLLGKRTHNVKFRFSHASCYGNIDTHNLARYAKGLFEYRLLLKTEN